MYIILNSEHCGFQVSIIVIIQNMLYIFVHVDYNPTKFLTQFFSVRVILSHRI